MKCERCSEDTHFLEECDHCKKQICRKCEKATDVTKLGKRKVICKDCWSDMKKRQVYKARTV